MRVIWKYPFYLDQISLLIPKGAEVLAVQTQRDVPCLWVKVDPSKPKVERTFKVVGTGHNFNDDDLVYIGTFQLLDGEFIGHIFEMISNE